MFNWWPVILLPLGMALFAALTDAQEKSRKLSRSARPQHTANGFIWVNKVATMAVHTLLATLVLAVLAGLITAKGAVPWIEIITASIVTWVASLVLIPTQQELADESNLSLPFISFIETGNRTLSLESLITILEVFDMSLSEFFFPYSQSSDDEELSELLVLLQKSPHKDEYIGLFL